MKHARKRAPTNRINFDYVCVRLMFKLSASAADTLTVRAIRLIRAIRAAGCTTIAVCVALIAVRAVRRTIRTLVVRGAVATVAYLTLVVAITVTVVRRYVRLRVRSGVRLYVRCYVRCYVRLGMGSRVRIVETIVLVTYTDVNVGTCANVDRDRCAGTVVVTYATAITVTPNAHLTVGQDPIQIAGVLVIPIIYDIIEVDTIGIAIATVCPFEIQIEEFRLLTCCKIQHHSHIAGHTLCLDSYSLATTTDGYFDSRCGVCGCGRCCIDGKDCRHCYC